MTSSSIIIGINAGTWPAWIEAIATAVAALAAISAVIYAKRAWTTQVTQIAEQRSLNDVQTALLTEQTEVLKLQQREILEAQERRDREAVDLHRAQARRVYVTAVKVTSPLANEDPNRFSFVATVENTSDLTIRDVRCNWLVGDRRLIVRDEHRGVEKLGSIAGGANGRTFAKADNSNVPADVEVRVVVEFIDGNNVHWRIDQDDLFTYRATRHVPYQSVSRK
jgi:hypothetical protein